jgi:hypothetical protein
MHPECFNTHPPFASYLQLSAFVANRKQDDYLCGKYTAKKVLIVSTFLPAQHLVRNAAVSGTAEKTRFYPGFATPVSYTDYFAGKKKDGQYEENELAMALSGLPSVA